MKQNSEFAADWGKVNEVCFGGIDVASHTRTVCWVLAFPGTLLQEKESCSEFAWNFWLLVVLKSPKHHLNHKYHLVFFTLAATILENMLNNSASGQITQMAHLMVNISSCLLLDRFQPVDSEEKLEVMAHELMRQNNFLASKYQV